MNLPAHKWEQSDVEGSDAHSPYYKLSANPLISTISYGARKKVFSEFMKFYRSLGGGTILDFGATGERYAPEANFLEKEFAEKHLLTAVSIEDATFLEQAYPGVRFVRIEIGKPLPFADRSIDFAFSHAVIEHIVDHKERLRVLRELSRVVRKGLFVTTPNKYFPIEVHTRVPLLHILAPSLFYDLCDRQILSTFYNRKNLDLLSPGTLEALASEALGSHYFECDSVRTFGWRSILILKTRV